MVREQRIARDGRIGLLQRIEQLPPPGRVHSVRNQRRSEIDMPVLQIVAVDGAFRLHRPCVESQLKQRHRRIFFRRNNAEIALHTVQTNPGGVECRHREHTRLDAAVQRMYDGRVAAQRRCCAVGRRRYGRSEQHPLPFHAEV